MSHPHVHRRPARDRIEPAPVSGVRLVDEEAPIARGWRGSVTAMVRGEFLPLGLVDRGDEMTHCRGERRI